MIAEPAADAGAPAAAATAAGFPAVLHPLTRPCQDGSLRERPFDDFERQPLLPLKLSQLGPGMAWADVNDDGRDDWFLGRVPPAPAAWSFPRQRPGLGRAAREFASRGLRPVRAQDKECEDTGLVFFDADGDGDKNLYAVSGGVQGSGGTRTRLQPGLSGSALPRRRSRWVTPRRGPARCPLTATVAVASAPPTSIAMAIWTCSLAGVSFLANTHSVPPAACFRNDAGTFVDVTTELPGPPALASGGTSSKSRRGRLVGRQRRWLAGSCWSQTPNGDPLRVFPPPPQK